jgi:anaerobic selenocysteine-containing dehydrogenase
VTTRREFFKIVPIVSLAATASTGFAQAKVDPKDAQATSLAYVEDATTSKHTKYVKGNACSNCQLYQGAAAPWGGCPIFAGKQVAAKGWCSAWVKKA